MESQKHVEDDPNENQALNNSYQSEQDDMQKKMLQGFNELEQPGEMICKILRKDYVKDDDKYENIKNTQAYTAMFQAHKTSKFGSKYMKQKSNKLSLIRQESEDLEEYVKEEVDLDDIQVAQISLL